MGEETDRYIAQVNPLLANNYDRYPFVTQSAEGVWQTDIEGRRILDLIAGYSAVAFGHSNPAITTRFWELASKMQLTTSKVYNAYQLPVLEALGRITHYDQALFMNSGTEAVETAVKIVRRWGEEVKGIPPEQAEIIGFWKGFHGRGAFGTAIFDEPEYRDGFGPYLPGVVRVPYGDIEALEAAINPNTAAIVAEPLQVEGGMISPPDGYFARVAELARQNRVLLVADEVQTGFGRTSTQHNKHMFASFGEGVKPDVMAIGKAFSAGILPVSAALADRAVMDVIRPGAHGSTFGGSPTACAAALATLEYIESHDIPAMVAEGSEYFDENVRRYMLNHKLAPVRAVRGRGLLQSFLVDTRFGTADEVCDRLFNQENVLTAPAHDVVRFTPPTVITPGEMDIAFERLNKTLTQAA